MNVRSAVDLLQQVPLFAGVAAAHLQALLFSSSSVEFAAGETVFSAGQPASSALLVTAGEAVALDAADETLAHISRGALLGELSMIAGLPRSVTVRAVTRLSAVEIDNRTVMRLVGEFPEVGASMLRTLSDRLGFCSDELAEIREVFDSRRSPT